MNAEWKFFGLTFRLSGLLSNVVDSGVEKVELRQRQLQLAVIE